MNPSNSKTVILYASPSAETAAAVLTGQIDTEGFDYLVIDINDKTNTSAVQCAALEITENDTALTDATAGTDIAALTGAAVTSATAGFVLPTPSSACLNHYRFNIDLKGRQRFIAARYQGGSGALSIMQIIGTLHRCQDGPAATASTTVNSTALIHQQRLIASA